MAVDETGVDETVSWRNHLESQIMPLDSVLLLPIKFISPNFAEKSPVTFIEKTKPKGAIPFRPISSKLTYYEESEICGISPKNLWYLSGATSSTLNQGKPPDPVLGPIKKV